MHRLLIGTAALALAACTNTTATESDNVAAANVALTDEGAIVNRPAAAPTSGGATAQLRTVDGKEVGTVTASADENGVVVTVDARTMVAGIKGMHVHSIGRCEGPKFESAGPHWNPTGRQHGKDNPAGPHRGDLPNLDVGQGGTGTVTFTLPGAAIGGAAGLLDADGAAFVIHAAADDYRTDPSGNSGDRIACGVFSAG